jgi:hypothetical protein
MPVIRPRPWRDVRWARWAGVARTCGSRPVCRLG